jgi:Lon protease-like protein
MGMNAVYRGPEDCPSVVPVFPLPGALLLPRGQMPLNIFEPRYLAMVDEALRGSRIIGMVQPDADNDPHASVPNSIAPAAPAASPSSPRPATAATSSP